MVTSEQLSPGECLIGLVKKCEDATQMEDFFLVISPGRKAFTSQTDIEMFS